MEKQVSYTSGTEHQERIVELESNTASDLKAEDVSVSVPPSFQLSEADQKIMRRLRWKIDLWILPLLSVVYFLASLDRSNIGNAQIAGMQEAIHADDHQWAQVASLFYIGYILSQPFGTLALRRCTPPITIGSGIISWGLFTTLLLLVKTGAQAIGVRILIGAAEGFIHAASLYLSFWYGPKELATRGAIYFGTFTFAGAFNGLISYAISKNFAHDTQFDPWQWIFLIEGVITIAVGILVVLILPAVPERVTWGFTADEKRLAILRTWQANNTPNATFNWNQFGIAFTDPMTYGYVILFSAAQIALGSLSSFLPAVIKGMGYTSIHAQLMSVPVYAAAWATTIGFGILSDKFQRRGFFIAGSATMAMVGYIMLIATKPSQLAARYTGICLAAAGQFPTTNIILVWNACNTRNFTHRATAGTLVAMIAQAAALGGTQGFDTPPRYLKGNAVVLAVTCIMPPTALGMSWYYNRLNQRKAAARRDGDHTIVGRIGSFEELGNDHPDFVYSI